MKYPGWRLEATNNATERAATAAYRPRSPADAFVLSPDRQRFRSDGARSLAFGIAHTHFVARFHFHRVMRALDAHLAATLSGSADFLELSDEAF
jgi:hypothetical protein